MRQNRSALPILGISLLALSAMGLFAVQREALRTESLPAFEPFAEFFAAHGGRTTFGEIISPPYYDEAGRLNQAFEAGLMQMTLDGVTLAPLGLWLHPGEFESRVAVDERFAARYAALGGETILGAAITSLYTGADGASWQDFERGRLVQNASGAVQVGALGKEWIAAHPPQPEQLIPLADGALALPLIHPAISVAQPALGVGDIQTLYVYVQDEQGRPVEGAEIGINLYIGESRAQIRLSPSDHRGLSQASYTVDSSPQGTRVLAQARVLYRGSLATTEATYLIWW